MGVCVVCCTVKIKEQGRTIKTKKQVRKKHKERTRGGIQKAKKIPRQEQKIVFSKHQTGSGIDPASNQMDTGCIFGGREAGAAS
jgi:hypothetical protein